MRFHVIGLPHTNVTAEFSACAYTDRVRKFCAMLKAQGHTVYLYAGPKSDAICDEHIPCISEEDRAAAVAGIHYTQASFNRGDRHWLIFSANAFVQLTQRVKRGDFICPVAGVCHEAVFMPFLDEAKVVEFAVGYGGTSKVSTSRVYESYAWMHVHLGAHGGTDPDGNWQDTVIPPGFELEQYPVSTEPGLHYAYLGRMIPRKGVRLAYRLAEDMQLPFVTAGPGEPPSNYGTHLGVVGPVERGKLLSRAKALFVPTMYVEPFGNVAVEAMLCGTPVITSDWGAFTETVIQGVTGYRCRSEDEFKEAAMLAPSLDRKRIAEYARHRYGGNTVAKLYESHWNRLAA